MPSMCHTKMPSLLHRRCHLCYTEDAIFVTQKKPSFCQRRCHLCAKKDAIFKSRKMQYLRQRRWYLCTTEDAIFADTGSESFVFAPWTRCAHLESNWTKRVKLCSNLITVQVKMYTKVFSKLKKNIFSLTQSFKFLWPIVEVSVELRISALLQPIEPTAEGLTVPDN